MVGARVVARVVAAMVVERALDGLVREVALVDRVSVALVEGAPVARVDYLGVVPVAGAGSLGTGVSTAVAAQRVGMVVGRSSRVPSLF